VAASDLSPALRTLLRTHKSRDEEFGQLPYRRGDLVLLLIEHPELDQELAPSMALYARVDSVVGQSPFLIKLFLNPMSNEQCLAKCESILVFTDEMLARLSSPRGMQQLVYDPIDVVFGDISEQVKDKTNEFLASLGVNVDMMELVANATAQLTMADLTPLRRMSATFQRLQDGPPTDFYESMDRLGLAKLDALEAEPPVGIFVPTRQKAIADLRRFPFSSLAKTRIQKHAVNCASALEQLHIDRRNLLRGERKQQLTVWWLGAIRSRCYALLEAQGFVFDAVPADYINEPPADLAVVKSNLLVLRRVLNLKDDIYDVKSMLRQVCDEIYPRIDQYISDAEAIIIDLLKDKEHESASSLPCLDTTTCSWSKPPTFRSTKNQLPLGTLDQARARERAQALVDAGVLTTELASNIDGVLKDLDYLLEMKVMEQRTQEQQRSGGSASGDGKLVMSNVVPISGLVMSSFYRLENEMNTVLELWDKDKSPIVDTAPPGTLYNT